LSTHGDALAPALVGIDWGSSNLRVALMDAQGRVLQRRESTAGVFSVAGGAFAAALWPLCGDWLAAHPRLPLLACGMIGSRQGVLEVPYLPCPAALGQVAQALVAAPLAWPAGTAGEGAVLHIVPGLQCGDAAQGHDVMRGEETQLLGVAQEHGRLLVLPGTHSKWVERGQAGQVLAFQTYLTGELFELLRQHSSLARVMGEPQWTPQAFDKGVAQAQVEPLEGLLFKVRTAGLMERFAATALQDYLSGLLIGAEIKAGLRRFARPLGVEPVMVLGQATLALRYARALAALGHEASVISGDVVFSGLATIAHQAGLGAGARH
jgi:2-dehydro-3-deoxygalactonokinase